MPATRKAWPDVLDAWDAQATHRDEYRPRSALTTGPYLRDTSRVTPVGDERYLAKAARAARRGRALGSLALHEAMGEGVSSHVHRRKGNGVRSGPRRGPRRGRDRASHGPNRDGRAHQCGGAQTVEIHACSLRVGEGSQAATIFCCTVTEPRPISCLARLPRLTVRSCPQSREESPRTPDLVGGCRVGGRSFGSQSGGPGRVSPIAYLVVLC